MAALAPELLVEPSYFWAPPSTSRSLGDATIELCASAGLFLDPWQELCVRMILAEDDAGMPVAFEAAVIVARQNGKGSILEALCLGWLFLTDTPMILWSAHEFKTAAEGFRRIRALISNAPHLDRRIAAIRTAAGSEAIILHSGQRLRFVARSKGSGRGFTGGKVILDEAYELSPEDLDALLPTLSTRLEAQIVYTSSAGMATSEKLRSIRDRGRKGNDPALAYAEWGGRVQCPVSCTHPLPDEDGAETCPLNDREEWRRANPAGRVPDSFIAKERRALSAEGFARERLGVWDEPIGESPISIVDWTECADTDSTIEGEPVLAIDASPGLRSAAVSGAGWRGDGLAHGELVRAEVGTEWLVPYVVDVCKRQEISKVYLIGTAPARAFVPDLEAHGLEVVKLGDAETAAACLALQAEISERKFRHLGDPILTEALAGAARRDVGDGGWTWRRKTSAVDISPLVAMTVARWALTGSPMEPSIEELLSSFA
jgi:phage terminase large subunit-like protein